MRQPPTAPAATMPEPPDPRLREEALDWFVRRRNEGFGAQDERAFQSWLQADPRHGAAFAHWQGEWQAFDAVPAEMRAMLQADLARATAPSRQRAAPRRRAFVPAFAVAALVAVAAGTGVLAWNHWQAQPVFAQNFSSPRGQQVAVPLPDGSRLRLDTATRVSVAYYRGRREVTLHGGQAVFAVQADAQRPFDVLAGPLRVRVVGTRFSVRYTPDIVGGEGVQVAVEEGRVQVERLDAPAGDPQAVLLAAGQQVGADAAGTLSPVGPVADAGIAPWRDHRVRFDDLRLDRVLAELARYGDTRLVLRDPAVAALRLTGVFDPRDLSTFKRVLPLSLPVRLREVDGGTEVVAAR